jgi:hypothetical protein
MTRNGVRTVFHLDKKDRAALEKMSNATGAPLSELLRRAVAQYVRKLKTKRKS